ncbi:FAD/NAD(P)-binding protein [Halobacillus andaensis]|uniref:FAD/NAD(P)-binding protein n=1 Tax=Halobacillus andaensis TaxID=1176239 RepID=UPI003D76094A
MSLVAEKTFKKGTYFSKLSIGVIGGGASATSFLRSLLMCLKRGALPPLLNITIFESKDKFGSGFPYEEDFSCLRLNRTEEAMSVCNNDTKHFSKWVKEKQNHYPCLKDDKFISRNIFGRYLRETFWQTIYELEELGASINTYHARVIDVTKKDEGYILKTNDGNQSFFDFTLLCTGAIRPDDPYKLDDARHYIQCPYPAAVNLSRIPKTDSVAILGTSLTAIDMAISLKYKGHTGPIFMISRTGQLPTIKGMQKQYTPFYFTDKNINLHKKKNGFVSLRHLYRLLRKEFKIINLNLINTLFEKNPPIVDEDAIKIELENSQKPNKWFDILEATHPILDRAWIHVPEAHKQIFIRKYMSKFLYKRASIPTINAKIIHEMMSNQQLKIHGGIKDIQNSSDSYLINLKDQKSIYTRWIINATGPSRNLRNNRLINNLISSGNAVESSNGGIKVVPKNGAVIDTKGNIDYSLRAIGHAACGEYLFINNLETISKITSKVANEVSEIVNNQIQIRPQGG